MNRYQNPLTDRYASDEMSYVFSPDYKFQTWRKLWHILAKAEKKLGLDISDEQLSEMEENIECIDYELAAKMEKELRHDVMAHVHTFAKAAPKASPIIHLGATSCFVGDNTDLIQIKEGLKLIKKRLLDVIKPLSEFCMEYREHPALGFTHFQPAQLTTVGKRAALWLQDVVMDLQEVEERLEWLPFRGVKGTTGTQASFLQLFDDSSKIDELDKLVTEYAGFNRGLTITGQTYTRKIDSIILNVLAGIASTASKFSCDIRILQGLKEIEEPFEKSQIGSSAMAYKRNPMRSERITSLARFLSNLALNPAQTHATQWLERTLDDSANRRLALGEGFLAADAILIIMANVVSGLVVNSKVIEKRILSELPFMTTENVLMECVKQGGDRQHLHEVIRQLSQEAAANVKQKGLDNNLIELMKKHDDITLSDQEIDELIDPVKFIGMADKQVEQYLAEEVTPILEQNSDVLAQKAESNLKV